MKRYVVTNKNGEQVSVQADGYDIHRMFFGTVLQFWVWDNYRGNDPRRKGEKLQYLIEPTFHNYHSVDEQ